MKKIRLKHKILILFLSVTVIISSMLFFPTYTPAIKDTNSKIRDNSIAELGSIKLGGLNQTIMIRGNNQDNPVIIFLHGGPGYPFISYARKFQSHLEKNFVVVNWDQRGSGRSYSFFMDSKKMTSEHLLQDIEELIDYVCRRFNKEKVFIVGHSWGTFLGIETIQRVPGKVIAYVGIGQSVDYDKSDRIAYRYMLQKAAREHNTKALSELKKIGEPSPDRGLAGDFVQRKWLKKFGLFEREIKTRSEIVKGILFAPEYNLLDGFKYLAGNVFSLSTLHGDLEQNDLKNTHRSFDVPVFFCAGRYDYCTPSELVEEYYRLLDAPLKRFYRFEKSAHEPHLAEEKKFAEIMVEIRDMVHEMPIR